MEVIKLDIKNTLISIRESKGYSKKTVAEMTGIPYTTYIKYESGERKDLSMDAIVKIADFYGVTTDYLLGRKEQPKPLEQLYKMYDFKALEKALSENYLSLPQEKREDFVEFLYKTVQLAKLDTSSADSEETNKSKQTEDNDESLTLEEIRAKADKYDALYERELERLASQEQDEHSELA